jgi:uncharacterized glyoxalase superfamily protein PhnB
MEISQLIPELLVEDITKTINFYHDILGFDNEVMFPESNPVFVRMKKDNTSIMFYARHEFEAEIPKLKQIKMGGSFLLYLKISGIKAFYDQVKNQVTLIQSIQKKDYGPTEFIIEDCNGYLICYSEDE